MKLLLCLEPQLLNLNFPSTKNKHVPRIFAAFVEKLCILQLVLIVDLNLTLGFPIAPMTTMLGFIGQPGVSSETIILR